MPNFAIVIAYFLMTAIFALLVRDGIDALAETRWPYLSMPGRNLAVKTILWLFAGMFYTLFLYKVLAPSFIV